MDIWSNTVQLKLKLQALQVIEFQTKLENDDLRDFTDIYEMSTFEAFEQLNTTLNAQEVEEKAKTTLENIGLESVKALLIFKRVELRNEKEIDFKNNLDIINRLLNFYVTSELSKIEYYCENFYSVASSQLNKTLLTFIEARKSELEKRLEKEEKDEYVNIFEQFNRITKESYI